MKRWVVPWIILLALSLFAVRVLFWPDFYDSHDGAYHLIRMYQFHLDVINNQIPPRWAPTLLGGLGYPLFIVNYSLPYFLAEFFYLLGFSLYGAFKLVILLTFVYSTILMFIFLRYHFDPLPSFVGSMLFSYAPYRFANIFTRGALGESVALALIPLVFISIQQIKLHKRSGIFFASGSFALLFLAHSIVFGIISPLIICYAGMIFGKKMIYWRRLTLSGAIAVGFSAFQLLPSIFERQYMQFDARLLSLYTGHFISFFQVFRIPANLHNINTPLQLGIVHTVVAIIALLFWLRDRNRLIGLFLGALLISIFLTNVLSKSLWVRISFLPYVLYPWRFLSLAVFCSSFVGSWLVSKLKKKRLLVSFAICLFVVISSRHYTKIRTIINYPEERFRQDVETGTTENEFLPVGVSPDITHFAFPEAEFISGSGNIGDLQKKFLDWRVVTIVHEPSILKLALLWFPGWEIMVDDNPTAVNNFYKQYQGLIMMTLTPGKHSIHASFHETPVRKLGNITSMVTVLVFIVLTPLLMKNKEIKRR